MDEKDLEYIFNHNPFKEKNYYPDKLKTSTTFLHTDFLKRNNINYRFRKAKRSKYTYIDLQRRDLTTIKTITNLRYPTNSRIGILLTRDKLRSEQYLKRFNITTPDSKVFNSNDLVKAKMETFCNSNKPVVIKPLNSSLGRGVIVNVSEERFDHSWNLCINDSKKRPKNILVQNYMSGFEARVTVIEGAISSIVCRIPPYIIGNDSKNISELIDLKNIERSKCGYLSAMPILKSKRIEEFLYSNDKDFSYIPSDGEYVLLNSVSNTSAGGEILNITDLVTNEAKEMALNAVAALPGIYTGGLDIMLKSFDDKEPSLIEFNTFPVLALPTFPTYGHQENPSKSYFESIIAYDQFLNPPKEKEAYYIENEEQYIKNYLKFIKRKNELLDKYQLNIEDIY